MMTISRHKLGLLLSLFVALLLAACTGSSSTTEPTATQAAAVATATSTAESPQAPPSDTATPIPEPSATATPTAPSGVVVPDGEIVVDGSEEFIAWAEQALDLIETQAPEWYEQVTASIQTIKSVTAGSGMDVIDKVYMVGDETAHAPGYTPDKQLIWFAGTIVHDSCHSERYDMDLVYFGKEGEIACLTGQKAALQLFDTDSYFSDYVQSLIDGADDPENQYWNNPNRHW